MYLLYCGSMCTYVLSRFRDQSSSSGICIGLDLTHTGPTGWIRCCSHFSCAPLRFTSLIITLLVQKRREGILTLNELHKTTILGKNLPQLQHYCMLHRVIDFLFNLILIFLMCVHNLTLLLTIDIFNNLNVCDITLTVKTVITTEF